MYVSRCTPKRPTEITKKTSEQQDILRRKREINARYSRLLLSKTIQHFQSQGHVTISISEKLNDGRDIRTMKSIQMQEPKYKTISFWQLPKTLKCEFQTELNNSKAMKSVRTQTNFPRNNKKSEKSWSNERCNKNNVLNTTNEILSSKVSCEGNIMSVVMRSKYDEELEDPTKAKQRFRKNQSLHTARTPRRKYKSARNVDRSKNFWASYNNFILCNRSIELRITKLFSFQNTQYIVAFSENIFEDTSCCKIPNSSYYVSQYILYNIDACILEMCFVEHIIDLEVLMEYKMNTSIVQESKSSIPDIFGNILQTVELGITGECKNMSGESFCLTKNNEFCCETLNDGRMAMMIEKDDSVDYTNCRGLLSNGHKRIAMKISGVVLSLWMVYVYLRNYSYFFQ